MLYFSRVEFAAEETDCMRIETTDDREKERGTNKYGDYDRPKQNPQFLYYCPH